MPPPPPGLSRRTALGTLGAVAATLVSGCTFHGVDRRVSAPRATVTRRPEDPDVALAAQVLAREEAMLAELTATLHRHPSLAPVLAGARTVHRAHVALLQDAVPSAGSSAGPSAGPSAGLSGRASETPGSARTGSAAPRTGRVPAARGPALARLAGDEDLLAVAGRRSSFDARSGAFARVLASMAAAASQQSTHLQVAARDQVGR